MWHWLRQQQRRAAATLAAHACSSPSSAATLLHGSSGGGSAAVPLPLSFAWGGSAAAAAAAASSGRTPLRSSSHWQYYSRGVTDLGRYELMSDEMHVLSRGQRDKYQHHYRHQQQQYTDSLLDLLDVAVTRWSRPHTGTSGRGPPPGAVAPTQEPVLAPSPVLGLSTSTMLLAPTL